jgi:CRP-like cAMP-binding protein
MAPVVTTVDALRQLSAFSHLSLEQFDQLAKAGSLVTVPPDHMVVTHGDDGSDIFGILTGGLKIQRQTSYGTFQLARLKPGDVFGETTFIDGAKRSTDVVAEVQSELVVLNAAKLNEMVASDRRFEIALYWALWGSSSKKLRITNRMLAHFFSREEADISAQATSVGVPKVRGEPFDVDIRTKRDLFLECGLSTMESNFMASLSKEERFAPGETVFREGEPGEKLYVILKGAVRISKHIPGTGEEALAILERGSFFGEMALVDRRPRSADAVAHDQGAELLVIEDPVLGGLLDIEKLSSPSLLKMLCATVARRLRVLDEKIFGWYMLSGGSSTIVGRPPTP